MKPVIKVDIVSDVVCPWCYVGKRRFEKAVESLKDEFDFDIDYKAFELHPDVKDNTTLLDDYLLAKFGSEEQLEIMKDRVAAVAQQEGIEMNFRKDTYVPNTLLAHKLLYSIKDKSKKAELNEALLKAYFTNGVNVGIKEEIIKIAQLIEVNSEIIEEFKQNSDVSQVQAEENHYRSAGVNAVPSFIINNQFLVQGAQETETFIKAFKDIANPAPAQSCTPGSGCC